MIQNPITWPDGFRCAVSFSFDMDAESLLHIYHPDTAHNRVAMASRLRYGPEVAVPRIVDALARLGLRQTFFVPGWCVEQYPDAVQLIVDYGHEVAHHGYLHEKVNQLGREDERTALLRGLDAIVKATGRQPTGFRAPSGAFSRHTLDLLVEEGSTTTPRSRATTSPTWWRTATARSWSCRTTPPWTTGPSTCA